MEKYRVWFGYGGEFYAGEDPRCPSEWRGSGCYDIYKECSILAVADIWCKPENIEDLILDLMRKEYCISSEYLEIVKYVKIDTEEDDDMDEYVDDWHIIREQDYALPTSLKMRDFAKLWDGGKKAYAGDVFFTPEGTLIEVL